MGIQVDVLTLVVTTLITGAVGWLVKTGFDQLGEYFKESRAWRESVDERFDDIESKLGRSIAQQAAQTRSDIIHKCHRYIDDLGMASIEEKDALADEHKQYCAFCADLDVENDFINDLVGRVMALPERDA